MQYKINFSIDDGETTTIDTVTYTFEDGVVFDRDVPHFPMSQLSEQDKINNIINMGTVEKKKYDLTPKE